MRANKNHARSFSNLRFSIKFSNECAPSRLTDKISNLLLGHVSESIFDVYMTSGTVTLYCKNIISFTVRPVGNSSDSETWILFLYFQFIHRLICQVISWNAFTDILNDHTFGMTIESIHVRAKIGVIHFETTKVVELITFRMTSILKVSITTTLYILITYLSSVRRIFSNVYRTDGFERELHKRSIDSFMPFTKASISIIAVMTISMSNVRSCHSSQHCFRNRNSLDVKIFAPNTHR